MFPRANSVLSAYLKNSHYRASASVALAVAAAAGVGAASATTGAGPWASSLHNLTAAGHNASAPTASSQAGKNIFHAVITPKLTTRPASRPGHSSHDQHLAQQGALAALQPLPSHHAVVNGSETVHLPTPAKPKKPKTYTIYDSISPAAIPTSQNHVAVYGNGNYQASWSDVHGKHGVLWIDTNGSNPGCDVLDVEPGDATPSGAAQWVQKRFDQYPGHRAVVYTMRSEWSQVKSAIDQLPDPVKSKVRYWIADPTGVEHMVPGASATQWYWGAHFDKTKALPGF